MSKTESTPPQPVDANSPVDDAPSETKRTIRGSSLLLVGRFLAILINLATQVLIVRLLSREDYGAFAYALTYVALGSHLAMLGTDKAVSRFVPIYRERGRLDKMAGTITMIVGLVCMLGLGLVGLVHALQHYLDRHVLSDANSLSLLLLLVILIPFEALNGLFGRLLAIFAGARAVFFRRYLLGPLLKLAAVLSLIFLHDQVERFAVFYIVAAASGSLISLALLFWVVRQQGLLVTFRPSQMRYPVRRIARFTFPLLGSDTVLVLRMWLVTFVLELARGASGVAVYRAVLPVARLNLLVMDTFKLLYTPAAAKLFARNDLAGLAQLYAQNATWIALLTFPLFAITVGASRPLTTLLFGQQYPDAGAVLAVLALGFYVSSTLGCNALSLRVLDKVRALLRNDLMSAAVGAVLIFWLVPLWGAIGGALATTITLVLQNAFNQITLLRALPECQATRGQLRALASILIASMILFVTHWLWQAPWAVTLLSIPLAISLVLIPNARLLQLGRFYPELARLPWIGRWAVAREGDLV